VREKAGKETESLEGSPQGSHFVGGNEKTEINFIG